MKKTLLFVALFSISVNLFSQINYALYTHENVNVVCEANDHKSFFGITWDENKAILNEYDLSSGRIKKEFKCDLPENPINLMLAHPKKNILYLITSRKIDDTRNRYVDAVYTMDIRREKLKLLWKVNYNYKIPNKIGIVGNHLVFTTLQEPTWIFDLKKNYFQLLYPDPKYQLLSIAPSHEGYLMLNIKERIDGNVPVYFMDQKNKFSNQIGFLSPLASIHSEVTSVQLNTITLVDTTYNWNLADIRYHCFPLYNFEVTRFPFWLKQSYSLDKAFTFSGILFANETYIAVLSGNNISVYNYAEPHSTKPASFTDEDIAKLEAFMNERSEYNEILIKSESLDVVFDGLFYEFYSNNSLKYRAVQQHGSYFELKEYDQLLPLLKPGFRMDSEKQATLFEEALNNLFPVDAYNKKYINNYSVEKGWVFVRGEAFEKKYGVMVNLNDSNQVVQILYKTDL